MYLCTSYPILLIIAKNTRCGEMRVKPCSLQNKMASPIVPTRRWCAYWEAVGFHEHIQGVFTKMEERSNCDGLVDRILNNILRCSPLVMSDCGLLLELGSFHHRGRCELFYNRSLRSSLPSGFRHDTIIASQLIAGCIWSAPLIVPRIPLGYRVHAWAILRHYIPLRTVLMIMISIANNASS